MWSLTLLPAMAQEQAGLTTRNPLDEIKDELLRVLSEAGVPFSEEQERSIALVIEESRRASEELFGDAMDFRDGPPRGEQLDRARAGIQWMNEDFSKRVRAYLNEEQLAAWDKHRQRLAASTSLSEPSQGTAGTKEQVQQIRINNNPFTTENQYFGYAGSGGSYGFAEGGGITTEIFQRGGTGAFHGTYEFRFRDEALNARNAFSPGKPPYQQRNFDVRTTGPVIPNRLTLSFGGEQTEQENVGTIKAETVDGPFQLGFTRPSVNREVFADGTYQVARNQSLEFDIEYGMSRRENQGMGGFNLPERAYAFRGNSLDYSFRHVWFMSERMVQDISIRSEQEHEEIRPVTQSVAIDVLGAFSSGGHPERGDGDSRTYLLRTLWIYTGDRWALRTGGALYYTTGTRAFENNFLGSFEFSDLDSFRRGEPNTYRVTRGDPVLRAPQAEWSVFVQNDFKYSDRLTLFYGLRYEAQQNLPDRWNFGPRVGAAYAVGSSTVVRAGAGLFHRRLENWVVREVKRLDGISQREILVSRPSYPDPFRSGEATLVPPASRRLFAEDLVAPYNVNVAVAVERSLPRNLFVSASYDYHRGVHQLRSRDLNAPLPGTPPGADGRIPRPDPSQGRVLRVESTGLTTWNAFKVNMRQRFSIFNVNANYTFQLNAGDPSWDGPFSASSDNYNLDVDWASVPRHQFSANVNSRLPLGVFLTTSLSMQNGNPYSITTGKDDNGDGVTNDRPPGVPRLSEIGPMSRRVDFNISKAFNVGKGRGGAAPNLNVFANMTNAFNRTNFGTPVGVRTSPLFGKSISASNPREIEVGLRFQF